MKILVATDGSKASLHAVRYAVKLIGQLSSPSSSVTLVSVHDDTGLRHAKAFVGNGVVADYLRELSEKELKSARRVLDAARIKHDMVVRTGHIATEIVAWRSRASTTCSSSARRGEVPWPICCWVLSPKGCLRLHRLRCFWSSSLPKGGGLRCAPGLLCSGHQVPTADLRVNSEKHGSQRLLR